ncbi:MAG: 50S ribosomal protein L18 [Sphingomonadales bacterium]|nr:50S ribosomal protein L18 [Sphingomonadales bacterium]
MLTKQLRRNRIRRGIRKRMSGDAFRPRLSVFRSNNEIYAQIIDDKAGTTLAAACSKDKSLSLNGLRRVEASALVGKLLAERALQAGVSQVVFDRNGYLYHGRVKGLAEGAREGGLDF